MYSYSNYYHSSNYLNETPTVHGLAANKMNDLAQEQNAAIYFIIIGLTKTVAQHAVVLVYPLQQLQLSQTLL